MTGESDSGRITAAATFTIVTCHFGDLFWIEQLTSLIDRTTLPAQVPEIVIVNQQRSTQTTELLASLPRVGRVVEYAPHPAQVRALGHDHPQALNKAIREPHSTSHVLVMDSDALPIADAWLNRLAGDLAGGASVMARDPSKWGLSHPCLMAIPVNCLAGVDFAEGCEELGIDTGRLVALQLSKAGRRVVLLEPDVGFSGHHGFTYLGGSVYHHGSGSFGSSTDSRLLRQVDRSSEDYFRRRVAAGRYHLTRNEQRIRSMRRLARRIGLPA